MQQELKDNILATTAGTKTGAILACAVDPKGPRPYPCFVGKATVTSDGFVMCDFFDSQGQFHMGAFVGSHETVWNNVANLSEFLKLTPAQAAELNDLVVGWIATDYRSTAARSRS